MSYIIEGKDIVISGLDEGIADTPYEGIADMRNMEIISVPGEGFVEFSQTPVTQPPTWNAIAFTAQSSGDTITVSSTTGLYIGCALKLITNSATGLSTGIVYYVFGITATTFQVRLAPAAGSAVNITVDGSGTLTTYQYGNQRGTGAKAPVSYHVDRTGKLGGSNAVFVVDGSNYLWFYFNSSVDPLSGNTLYFLGNIGGVGASSTIESGVVVWKDYLILFGGPVVGADILDLDSFWSTGPVAGWTYAWQGVVSTRNVNGRIGVLVSQEDGNVYWTSLAGLGSLIEEPGETFDPSDTATYSFTTSALLVPDTDESTCLDELGGLLLIGGRCNLVYVWDKISPGFNSLLNIPDEFTTTIVAASQNAYIFSGNRGRIYVTNGSGIELYKKVPDYVTGVITPTVVWSDANFIRNQLIFSFTASTNAGVAQNTVVGVWAIDLKTNALRLLNKVTGSGYTGTAPMVIEIPPASSGLVTGVVGTGITVGWYTGSTYVIDVPASTPYTSYESYFHSDIIPVGTYLEPFTPSQVEWKTSVPLVSGEGVRISCRPYLSGSFTQLGESTTAGAISDLYKANFQKYQWLQFLVEIKSTASTPSYARITEIRIRDWPSSKVVK